MSTKNRLHNILKLKKEPKIFIDPIFGLINEHSEIINDTNNTNFTELLYFNKDKIQSNLYNNNDIINLNDRLLDNHYKQLSFIFYLVLLIQNGNFIYFVFSFFLIKKIHNIINNNNNNNLYKIIKSKLILELLYYFKGIEIYEENENEIKKIENEK